MWAGSDPVRAGAGVGEVVFLDAPFEGVRTKDVFDFDGVRTEDDLALDEVRAEAPWVEVFRAGEGERVAPADGEETDGRGREADVSPT